MSEYNFIGKDSAGNVVKDSLQAKSRYEAVSMLQERDLTVVSVSEDRIKRGIKPRPIKKKKRIFSSSRISLSEFSIFCRQLSVCIASGINLLDALKSISEDMENEYFRETLCKVIDDVRDGQSFSDAVAKHGKAFSPLFIALVRAAEESGSMRMILNYLSIYLEKSVRLQRKIRSITAYPVFVALFFVIVIMVVSIFILPRFESLFASFGAQLPRLTRIIFGINRFIGHHILLFAIGIIGIIVGVIVYGRRPNGRYNIDQFKLKIPLFGKLIRKTSLARFCRILALMIRGGVPIVNSIDIASKVSANRVLEKSLDEAKEQIIDGSDIATSLERDGNFPLLMVRMVGIGESSGRLHAMLDNVSDMYEDEVEGSIAVATSVFEPIIIVLFGGVILVLVLAIYVPIFTITMSIR